MRSLAPNDNRLVRDFATKNDKKDEFFHSSSYATAQNAGNIGTASTGLTMEERKAIEAKRKFVQKYNNSKIFESTFGLRHAKKYIPRTEGGQNALYDRNEPVERTANRMNVTGDANGNVRQSFGRSAGDIGGKPGEKSGNSYTPFSTGSAPKPSKPSISAGFSANIKPKFR